MIEDRYKDSSYLSDNQYHTSHNLNARIEIHRRFSTGKQDWNDFIFGHLPLEQACNGLALGCGNASQWRANRQRFPEGLRMVLSEYSYGMLNEPRLSFKNDPRFMICTMDAMDIAFEANRFDFVTANHMLYHVPDIQCALAEIARVLKPEGMLMAATNGSTHMVELDQLLTEFNSAYEGEHAMSMSFNLQNGREQLLKSFEEVELVPYESDLWVTDASLLSDYAFSMPKVQALLKPEQKEALRDFFQQGIDKRGGIFIAKQTGIFIARKPRK